MIRGMAVRKGRRSGGACVGWRNHGFLGAGGGFDHRSRKPKPSSENPHSPLSLYSLYSNRTVSLLFPAFTCNEELEGDHPTTSFSQLLFGDNDDVLDHSALLPSSLFSNIGNGNGSNPYTSKMLCFGDHHNDVVFDEAEQEILLSHTTTNAPLLTSSESSSASNSSSNNNTNNNNVFSSFSHKKRNGSGLEPLKSTGAVVAAASGGRRQSKKTKADNPGSTSGHAKKKEKLGERIAALQQLVSPFGKTDTASVLHEAMGYIRFLHDQVQVLCSPYLQRLPSSSFHHHHHLPGDAEEDKRDLRSRGLCLIPVESTVHVASSNGADFWSPAMATHTTTKY
ncbi:transcription factor bHLH113 [Senna tora]|uniref:Transcription factor bHLH113 n=1 Tax=Senna tora TaxID=362788 RepID=A0A835CIX2_9FABA|nr:transcription factor bHLH113 [Senna tora]